MEKTYVFDPSQVILTLNSDKVKQLNTYFDFGTSRYYDLDMYGDDDNDDD